jgi:predicted dehydrogenase
MAEATVKMVIVGAGGYGGVYLDALFDQTGEEAEGVSFEGHRFVIAGIVDPKPRECRHYDALLSARIPVFERLEDFYQESAANLAVISSPIQFHCPQTLCALAGGSHVLCEKPAAATPDDLDRMEEAAVANERWVAVGFQWSFAPSILELKRDIAAGRFGHPRCLRSICLWPRDRGYYTRNDWAGKRFDDDGRMVNDSPINNAMAHDLHNMLFVLGNDVAESAVVETVTAELYRANQIETFDTAALKCRTKSGVDILFYGSHAIDIDTGPVFEYEFSDAVVTFPGGDTPISARLNDGSVLTYQSPNKSPHDRKLWQCIDLCIRGGEPTCRLSTARAHSICVAAADRSMPEPMPLPANLIQESGDPEQPLISVMYLAEELQRCYAAKLLPSEMYFSWAGAGEVIGCD